MLQIFRRLELALLLAAYDEFAAKARDTIPAGPNPCAASYGCIHNCALQTLGVLTLPTVLPS